MTTKDEIFAKIKAVLADKLDIQEDSITLSTRLEHDLGMDSLDTVETVMALEDAFDLELVDDEAIRRVNTVEDAIFLIKNAERKAGHEH